MVLRPDPVSETNCCALVALSSLSVISKVAVSTPVSEGLKTMMILHELVPAVYPTLEPHVVVNEKSFALGPVMAMAPGPRSSGASPALPSVTVEELLLLPIFVFPNETDSGVSVTAGAGFTFCASTVELLPLKFAGAGEKVATMLFG